jgi:hypothetical protein
MMRSTRDILAGGILFWHGFPSPGAKPVFRKR